MLRFRKIAHGALAAATLAAGVAVWPMPAEQVDAAVGPVSGKVFRDSNWSGGYNGSGSLTEGGLPGVTLRAYYDNNVLAGTATTNDTGDYTFNVTGPVRIELDAATLPAGMYQSDNGRPFTFFADGNMANQNIPVVYPAEFPLAPTQCAVGVQSTAGNPCFLFTPGVPITLINTPTATDPFTSVNWDPRNRVTLQWSFQAPTSRGTVRTYGVNAYGSPGALNNGSCPISQVGTTFGLAINPQTNEYYQGAWVKRHTPLGPTGSPTAIYRNCSLWVDLAGAAGSPNPHNTANMIQDVSAIAAVGRQGVGGMDVSSDMTGIYAVNMNSDSLSFVPFATAVGGFTPSAANTWTVPNACPSAGTRQAAGLTVKDGYVYVASTCEGSLDYRVHRFNETTMAWDAGTVLSGSHNAGTRMSGTFGGNLCGGSVANTYETVAWNDNNFTLTVNFPACLGAPAGSELISRDPQLLITDIDFAANGNMILAARDRVGDLMAGGAQSAPTASTVATGNNIVLGDVILGTKTAAATWTPDANAGVSTEVFVENATNYATGGGSHTEPAVGSLSVSPGTGRIMVAQFDPIDCDFGVDSSASGAAAGATAPDSPGGGINLCNGFATPGSAPYSTLPVSFYEQGVRYYPAAGGKATDALVVAAGPGQETVADRTVTGFAQVDSESLGVNGGFAKGNGLGDIAFQTQIALVGIGNRVFADVNNNGIQDPATDSPLNGVTVQLLDSAGTVVATTTTNPNGEYQFWAPGSAATYTVRIPSTQFTSGGPLAQYTLATADGSTSDESDSDGVGTVAASGAITSNVDAAVSIAGSGQSVRRVDFGFVPLIDLTLTKALTSANPTTVGATVTFTLTPRNEGPGAAVAGWSVTDILPSGLTLVSMSGTGYTCVANTCTSSTALAPATNGNPITVTATAASTGTLHNVAYVAPAAADVPELNVLVTPNTSTDTSLTATNNDAQADVEVNAATDPAIEIVKSINGQDANTAPGVSVNAGDTMNITYVVTNIGAEDLENVAVTDDVIADVDITCPQTTLAVGESMTCNATHPAPAAGALHTNIGTVNAESVVDGAPVTDTDPANATSAAVLAGSPGIHIEKYISNDDADSVPGVMFAAGDLMPFTFEVTNTGDVPLGNVTVTDTVLADADITFVSGDSNSDGFLDVTETWLYEAILAAPLPGQTHQNVATVVGEYTPPAGPTVDVTDNDPANAWTPGNPAIEVVKTINGADANLAPGVAVTAGSDMDIEYVITNIGNVVLTNVYLYDDVIADADITCPSDTLAVGASMTCTATYPAPAVGVQHTNTATATGDYVQPNGQFIRVEDEDPANAHVPAPPAPLVPAIEIVKTINGADANETPGVFVTGASMTIEWTVTNTGTATLSNLVLTDDVIPAADITCPPDSLTTLAPGDSFTCTATFATPAPGTVHTNIGTVTGDWTDPDSGDLVTVEAEDPANAWTVGNPEIRVVKSINGDDANVAPGVEVAAGDPMAVTFEVTNIGNVPLVNVRVTDSVLADTDITCPQTTLAIGETITCTATLPALAAEGLSHTNVAQATGDFAQPNGDLVRVVDTDPANAHVPEPGTDPVPAVQIVKYINDQDANVAPGVKVPAGSDMAVRYVVTNPGTVPVANVAVTDDVIDAGDISFESGDLDSDGLLDINETWVYTATFPAPAAGVVHTNIGTVDAEYIDPDTGDTTPLSDSDPANAWVEGNPRLELTKFINGDDANVAPGVLVAADSAMTVTFVVENTGDVTVDQIVVTDNVIPAGDIVCPAASLAAGESMTCTATWTAPGFGGDHSNTGEVEGVYVQPDGTREDLTDTDPAHAHADALPGLELTKYINGDDANAIPGVYVAPGSTMNITFVVENTSDVTVENIVLTDDVHGAITCPESELAPGATMTCTTTGAAPAAGTVHTNVATVVGDYTDVAGTVFPVTDSDPANAWTLGIPAISVVKSINGDDANQAPGVAVAAGSTMNITFEVTNIGEVPLSNVTVTDSVLADADITCPAATLAVGASMTCTATLTAPADSNQQHTNTATATGVFVQPNGQVVTVTDTDPANAFVPGAPGIHLEKLVNGDDADFAPGIKVPAGSDLSFEFIVTNTGQVPVANVIVTDDTIATVTYESGDIDGDDLLDVGEVWLYTGTGPAPAAGDVHTNIGAVTGDWTDPVSGDVLPLSDDDPANAWVEGNPRLDLTKFINGDDANVAPGVLVAADSAMTVTFVVENTGNVTVNNIVVTDNVIPAGDIVCPQTSLAAGASMTCTATWTAPGFGGDHSNTGVVNGDYTQPDGTVVDLTDTDPAHAHADALPGLELTKYINGDDANAIPGVYVAPGSTMNITFVVENTSDVTVQNIVLTDDVYGTIACPAASLAPGETMTCTITGPAPAAGTVHTNVATVVGDYTDVEGTVFPVTDSDPANAWTVGQPLIEIVKSINGQDANLAPGVRTVDGSTMNVTFEVRNIGNVPLSNVYVFDNVIDQADITCPAVTLAVGATMTCTATYPAPAVGGSHVNTATAHGEFIQPNGNITPVEDSDPAHAYTPGDPAIVIVKTINGQDANTQAEYVRTAAGSTMNIEYLVTNTGNVTLENVTVTDPTIGNANVHCEATILEAGESMTCTATFPAPAPGTYHTNTGFVRGDYRPIGGTPRQVRDNDPAWAYTPQIDLELVKNVTAGGVGATNDPAFIPADTKTGTVGVIRLDRPFQYQIIVTNRTIGGTVIPDAATGVTVGDLIPAGVTATAITASQGTCDLGAATCDLGTIANGASVTIIIDAVLPRTALGDIPADGLIVNEAEVTAAVESDLDSTPGNGFTPAEDDDNPAWVKINLADLELVKTINMIDNGDEIGDGDRETAQDETSVALPVAIGTEAVWGITVTNEGPDAASNVTVNDVLPAGWQFVDADGAYDDTTDVWTVGSLAAGQTVTLNITAILVPAWAGDQDATPTGSVNVAEIVTADQDDPDSIVGNGLPGEDDIDDAKNDPLVGSLGDFVWHDVNGNGVQDAGEPALAGVTVTLTSLTDVVDSNGTVVVPAGQVWTTTTSASGIYGFTNLYGGDYTIEFSGLPTGMVPTGQDEGDDNAADSDADTAGVIAATLAPGTSDITFDAGFYLPASIGNFVWEDLDGNGLQDAGEPGIAGVTVTLTGPYGAPVTATTGADGFYLFDGLRPGAYQVSVTAPEGMSFTAGNVGSDDLLDSDTNNAGVMAETVLESGENDLAWDAGLFEPASLGDFVWHDLNENGVQDAGEPGLEGITVTLTGTTNAGVAVNLTVSTDGAGGYLFDGLAPGTYTVQVAVPSMWVVSPQNVGDAASDSNIDGLGAAAPVTLTSGQDDLTIDAGMFQPIDLQIVKTGVITGASKSKPASEATVTWTFTVTNNGPGVARAGATIDDVLPVGLLFQSVAAGDGWSCVPPAVGTSGGMLDCVSTAPMQPGATAVFTVIATVAPSYNSAWASSGYGALVASWSNTATVTPVDGQTDIDTTNNSSTAVVELVKPPAPTGASTFTVLLAAAGLAAAGALLFLIGRRRRKAVI